MALTINDYPIRDDKALVIVARLERRNDPDGVADRVAEGIRSAIEYGLSVRVSGAEVTVIHDVLAAWLGQASQFDVGEQVVDLFYGLRHEIDLSFRTQRAS